jgi:hypothetical protein
VHQCYFKKKQIMMSVRVIQSRNHYSVFISSELFISRFIGQTDIYHTLLVLCRFHFFIIQICRESQLQNLTKWLRPQMLESGNLQVENKVINANKCNFFL